MRIAIQPDDQLLTSGRRQSFSRRAAEVLAELGHEAVAVDVRAPDFYAQVAACDGFMWWFAHLPNPRRLGQRVVQSVEHALGVPVFPSWKTIWHFDDKVAQHYLLAAAGIPTPRTWVLWTRAEALEFVRGATYPLVLKLAGGIISENVGLVRSADEAEQWTERLFGPGLTALVPTMRLGRWNLRARVREATRLLLTGDPPRQGDRSEVQRDYLYVQEFLAGNDGDTRVVVVGDRAWAVRRYNRPNDFRASGSGLVDTNPEHVSLECVRLAFRVARSLDMQSCGVDCLRKDGRAVIGEISYYYEAWIVPECPGHWELRGDAETGELVWIAGSMRAEDAIVIDFVESVRLRSGRTSFTTTLPAP
jgi:hypothetical protein